LRAILAGEATLLLSVPLALQYEAVLTRPEHLAAAGATVEQITALLDALLAVCRPVEISFLWRPILRDADDEMVLEVAVNGRADRLLTFNERDFAGSGRLGVTVERPGPAWRSWRNG
jgi:predicted nucleic acid-binding protein